MSKERVVELVQGISKNTEVILELTQKCQGDYYKEVLNYLESLDYGLETAIKILTIIHSSARPAEEGISFHDIWMEIYNDFFASTPTKNDLYDLLLDYEPDKLNDYLSEGIRLSLS